MEKISRFFSTALGADPVTQERINQWSSTWWILLATVCLLVINSAQNLLTLNVLYITARKLRSS